MCIFGTTLKVFHKVASITLTKTSWYAEALTMSITTTKMVKLKLNKTPKMHIVFVQFFGVCCQQQNFNYYSGLKGEYSKTIHLLCLFFNTSFKRFLCNQSQLFESYKFLSLYYYINKILYIMCTCKKEKG